VDGEFIPFIFLLVLREDVDKDSGRHFDGEESFNTGPMAPSSEPPVNAGVTKL
jgi:hypothetical protein